VKHSLVRAIASTYLLPRLLGITTDNASNIDKLLDCLEGTCRTRGIYPVLQGGEEEQHVRCIMAHVTNLGAQALLGKLSAAVEDADLSPEDSPTPAGPFSCVDRLRSLAAKVRSSPRLASASGRIQRPVRGMRHSGESTHFRYAHALELHSSCHDPTRTRAPSPTVQHGRDEPTRTPQAERQ